MGQSNRNTAAAEKSVYPTGNVYTQHMEAYGISATAGVGLLTRLGKRELICLLSFTCNYVVSVRRGFLFLLVLGMGCVILLWHCLCLQYNYFPLLLSC